MRLGLTFALIVTSVCLLAVGCSDDGQSDSETHWQNSLQACNQDSDCGSMLSCLCGMCTTTCQSDTSVCGNLSGNASCALESGTVFQLCGGDASVPDSICASECTTANDCPDGQSCVSGYCSPRDSTGNPDGGEVSEDGAGDVPTDAPDDGIPEAYRCGEPGNPDCCKADFYPNSQDARQIPAFHGEYESSSFELAPGSAPAQLTFDGVVDAAIRDVPCPPNATDRGIFCQVDYAMSFEGGDVEIFLGLPRSTLESLASPGDTLTLDGTMFDGDVNNLLLTAADGSVLLDLGYILDQTSVNDEVFEADRDDYRLFMQESGDDFSQAECLEGPDECDRMYAVLRATLEYGNQTEELEVDTTFDFSSNGTDYTLRYFVSFERIGLPMSCTDATPARMNYLVVGSAP